MDLQALTESLRRIISAREDLAVEAKRVQKFLDEVELQLSQAGIVVPAYVQVTSGLHSLGWDKLEGEAAFALVWASSGFTAEMMKAPLVGQSIERRALAAQHVPQLFEAIEKKLVDTNHNIRQAFPPSEEEAGT